MKLFLPVTEILTVMSIRDVGVGATVTVSIRAI
jgi:hypothetical protein